MDVAKVNGYMDEFARIEESGVRLAPSQRTLRKKIREAPLLDRVDANVLVRMSDGEAVRWENYIGCNDYTIQDGNLSVLVSGVDADGEWCTGKMVCYPAGRWLKFETSLTSVPNPYYADPDGPDPDSEVPGGFGG